MIAVQKGNQECFSILLAQGASVNTVDEVSEVCSSRDCKIAIDIPVEWNGYCRVAVLLFMLLYAVGG